MLGGSFHCPDLAVLETSDGLSLASFVLAGCRRWTAYAQGNGQTFSGFVQTLPVALRGVGMRVCAYSLICVFSPHLLKYLSLWPRFGTYRVHVAEVQKPWTELPFPPSSPGNMKRSSRATCRSFRRSPRRCVSGPPSGGSSTW